MSAAPSVFLTYGWCRVSYVILHALARRGVTVHVGDSSGLAMCRYSRRAASFSVYRSPYRDPDGFVADVAAAVERTGAGVLIPGHEDAVILARARDRLGAVVLPVGDPARMARLTNKWTLVEDAASAGLPVPPTWKPVDAAELESLAARLPYPLVIKPQIGNSAKGVFVVHGPDECRRRYRELIASYALPPPRWPILQDYVAGDGYGVCLLYNRGAFRAAFCERYLRAKDGRLGTSVLRESVLAPELIALARRWFDRLDWHGVVHLDFLRRPNHGDWALIEINPRFWGALDLAVRAGVDFPGMLYQIAATGDTAPVAGYQAGVRSRWIVGELLHLINHLRRGRLASAARSLSDLVLRRSHGCDDFRRSDPLPLLAELAYYGSRFVQTGSANPVEEGMVG
jgi:predicted ATP-grasp superfamily ATP-dependent carboligase